MKQPIFIQVPIHDILIDQRLLPNIRGKRSDTTELQQAIKEENLLSLFPLKVIRHPESDGYLLWDGSRRLRAAKKNGIEEVPCYVVDITLEQALDAQIAADLREQQPQIVLDGDGVVVAGLCWAAYQLHRRGYAYLKIGRKMGVSSNTASAYVSLFDEIIEIKRRVKKGEIAITVYARLKEQDEETKLAILQKKGKISRSFVDRFLKDQRVRDAVKNRAQAGETAEPDRVDFREAMASRFGSGGNVYGRLRDIADEIEEILTRDLSDGELVVLETITHSIRHRLEVT